MYMCIYIIFVYIYICIIYLYIYVYLYLYMHENEVYIYIYLLEIYTHQMELHPLNGGVGRTCVICLRSICWNSCDFPYIRRWAEWFLETRSSR